MGAGRRPRYGAAEAKGPGPVSPARGAAAAREAGIRWPVALTRAAYDRCVAVPPGVVCQDEAGRLWDVLWLLRCAIRVSSGSGSEVRFGVHVRSDNRARTPPLVR